MERKMGSCYSVGIGFHSWKMKNYRDLLYNNYVLHTQFCQRVNLMSHFSPPHTQNMPNLILLLKGNNFWLNCDTNLYLLNWQKLRILIYQGLKYLGFKGNSYTAMGVHIDRTIWKTISHHCVKTFCFLHNAAITILGIDPYLYAPEKRTKTRSL